MIRVGRGRWPAIFAFLIALAGAPGLALAAPPAPVENQVSQLDTSRQQCISTAAAVQRRENSIGALDLAIKVMERGIETKKKEIALRRDEQEALLGALERLARAPPEALALAREGPVDRQRSAILIGAAVPALAAQALQLSGQLAALTAAQRQVETRRQDVDDARAALAKSREQLAQLVTRRNALIAQLLHDDNKTVPADPIGDQATDLVDLIKKADAATEQRDKDLLVRLRVLYGAAVKGSTPPDPTKPKNLRALDAPRLDMIWPVAGELTHRFGEADRYGRPSQGLSLQAAPGALVVAPFDGRVDYVGPFRGYGLILIIRHGGGYHSLLAGLGHVDVTTGQWLLAGEPVGSLAEADENSAGATLYFELRREERPVDPQSRLASRDQKTEDTRVRE
ncbi:MAG TPA: peptidoglycan DD-metalloendopeptidase family protein [Stellaceae bacterium]|nr:peptidoglycan DD-metalloendopeptidase family protein [Stellaceae bacterium]